MASHSVKSQYYVESKVFDANNIRFDNSEIKKALSSLSD